MRTLTLSAIRLYQWTLSPLLGRCCRFHPSCSSYAHQAIHRFGLTHGTKIAAQRILKCHPWHPGGFDPVPEVKNSPSTPHSITQLP